jgi:hypothetical protein
MPFKAPNSELIRVVVIILFFAISVIFRARKKPTPAKPGAGAPSTSPLDVLRESMRQASDQARARRTQFPSTGFPSREFPSKSAPLQPDQPFQQPPTIQPESSFVPSLLLLALFACLCFMAYRYFAR